VDEENSRLLTIVRLFDLHERVFWETEHLPKSFSNIAYDKVNQRLKVEIEQSKKLLAESIIKYIL
jgi:hypothetical protein